MEKRKEKSELEQLLNSLIEKGWRIENPNARISDVKYKYGLRKLRIVYETDRRDAVRQYPIRFLVSKESGLGQFVCENCLQVGEFNNRERNGKDLYTDIYYEYRVIESSLKDESELEDFLLNSISLHE